MKPALNNLHGALITLNTNYTFLIGSEWQKDNTNLASCIVWIYPEVILMVCRFYYDYCYTGNDKNRYVFLEALELETNTKVYKLFSNEEDAEHWFHNSTLWI